MNKIDLIQVEQYKYVSSCTDKIDQFILAGVKNINTTQITTVEISGEYGYENENFRTLKFSDTDGVVVTKKQFNELFTIINIALLKESEAL